MPIFRMRSVSILPFAIIFTTSLVFPLSLFLQTSSFSLSLDLDGSANDQTVQSLDVYPNQDISIQIFGTDIQSANDLSARFEYDATDVVYAGFDAGEVLPNAQIVVDQDSTTAPGHDGTNPVLSHNRTSSVEINIASLDGSATVNRGLIGTIRFRTTDGFSSTEIQLVRAELSRNGQGESVLLNIRIALQVAVPPSPDFDGSGFVDSQDFSLFTRVFGYRVGQDQYEAKYDLNGDGKIGTEDFLIFIKSYGKRVKHAPVFTSRTYVTYFIDENTPGSEPIGSPISATDADGDVLIYSLSGKDVDLFVIDAHTGQIQTREGITYDCEHRTTYSVIVEVSDDQGGTARLLVVIKVNDLKEPPSSPPSNFLVIPDDESLTVHYATVPDERGRPPVRGYHAEIRKGEEGEWGTRKTIYGRTNTSVYYHEIDAPRYYNSFLENDQLYQVRVRAWNSDGASDWSEPVSGVPVYVPPKETPELVQFQGEGDMASANIDLSFSIGEGGKITVTRAALPASISQEDVEGIFVEIVKVEVSNAPNVPAQTGFTIFGSSSVFDINLRARVNNRDVDIDDGLRTSVEICLPVPAEVSDPVIVHYAEDREAWEMLDRQRADGDLVCGYTDRFSLFGVGVLVNRAPVTVADVNEAPGKPDAPSISDATLNSLKVSWSAPTNMGPEVSAYDIRFILNSASTTDKADDSKWTEIADAWTSGSLEYTIGSLNQNTGYDVQVRAKSDEGTGPWSDSVPGTTSANSAPVANGKIYWSDNSTDKIQRSNLDGSSVEDLVTRSTLRAPVGIALDISGGKIYWIDESTDKIQRTSLELGQGETTRTVEDLVTTGLTAPSGIALDISGGKMYWADRGTDKIQRSNLDGSSVEDLVTTGLTAPSGIALDISGGKMYWVDRGTDKVQRSNLDGSNVEDLITTGLMAPAGIALDISGGKMYWVDNGTDKIQRASLELGQGETTRTVEDLVTGVTNPRGIALDISGGKMYWVDNGADKIQRANLDGSNVEDVITTGLTTPVSIALDF